MRVYRAKDYNDMSKKAASIISVRVILKSDRVLGLTTGSSPIGAYKQLVGWYEKGDLDFSQVEPVNLGEYRGFTKDNDQNYYYSMCNNFFRHINIDLNNTNVPDGTEPDSEKECPRCDKTIENMGGVGLQLLGLGYNGHVGLDKPGNTFLKLTHCVDLQESTIEANRRLFADINDIPRQVYTMGIQTIMKARTILMVVGREGKAQILYDALYGPITPHVPASILQLHNSVITVADEAALSKMPK